MSSFCGCTHILICRELNSNCSAVASAWFESMTESEINFGRFMTTKDPSEERRLLVAAEAGTGMCCLLPKYIDDITKWTGSANGLACDFLVKWSAMKYVAIPGCSVQGTRISTQLCIGIDRNYRCI